MLYRKYRDKIVLPNMNFTNTQIKMQIPNRFNFHAEIPNSTKKIICFSDIHSAANQEKYTSLTTTLPTLTLCGI